MQIPRPSQIIDIARKLIISVVLHIQYNQWTIAEYFRKQGAQIGRGCSIKIHSLGQKPYLVNIGNHVYVAEGVVFRNRCGGVWIFREEIPDLQCFGPIIVEDNCIIGQNSVLLPNVKIGKNSIIEPGSVVNSNIPPNSVVIGAPAQVIGNAHEYKKRYVNGWQIQRPSDVYIEEGRNWWTTRHWKDNEKKLRRHLNELFFKK